MNLFQTWIWWEYWNNWPICRRSLTHCWRAWYRGKYVYLATL